MFRRASCQWHRPGTGRPKQHVKQETHRHRSGAITWLCKERAPHEFHAHLRPQTCTCQHLATTRYMQTNPTTHPYWHRPGGIPFNAVFFILATRTADATMRRESLTYELSPNCSIFGLAVRGPPVHFFFVGVGVVNSLALRLPCCCFTPPESRAQVPFSSL